ncbi:MAG TPA: DUF2147 domain-containing protein [Xanthobacteraceae bacterium]|nr:DUF2147 domain-containing protein [Xanthobacteraceae bacterium]
MHWTLSAILAAATCAATCETGPASPVGQWLAKDGAKIRISPCGRNLCGFIVQASSPTDPTTGRPPTDKNNADPAKRARPLVGVEVLISMHHDGPTQWSGQLYNDNDGKIYSGNLIETGPSGIRIEGCWLGICGGEDLTRIR